MPLTSRIITATDLEDTYLSLTLRVTLSLILRIYPSLTSITYLDATDLDDAPVTDLDDTLADTNLEDALGDTDTDLEDAPADIDLEDAPGDTDLEDAPADTDLVDAPADTDLENTPADTDLENTLADSDLEDTLADTDLEDALADTDLEDVPAGGVPLVHVHRHPEERPGPQAVDLLQGRVPVPAAGVGGRGDGPAAHALHHALEALERVQAVGGPRRHAAPVEGSDLALRLPLGRAIRVCVRGGGTEGR